MMSGYMPFWGASVLLFLRRGEPILFLPALEPRDHIPNGLRVHEYPWGMINCAEPFSVLVENIRLQLHEAEVPPSLVAMLPSARRSSLPMQAAEQTPIEDAFRDELASMTAGPDTTVEKAFLDLYLTKSPEEIKFIRLANAIATFGIQAFREALRPGVTEAEVATLTESAIAKQVGVGPVFYARGWAAVQSGPNSGDAGRFNRSTGRRLQDGDLVLLE